jgi:hypothetical protein
MIASYDLFRLEPNGGVLWIAAWKTFAEAEKAARQHALKSAGPYMIFDQVTRSRIMVEIPAPL